MRPFYRNAPTTTHRPVLHRQLTFSYFHETVGRAGGAKSLPANASSPNGLEEHMISKPNLLSAATVALLALSNPVFATAGQSADAGTIPVLIKVDAAGNVTEISPWAQLSDELSALLQTNVKEMVVSPATNAAGRRIESQFLANMQLVTEPTEHGQITAHFSNVSIKGLPNTGRWYWANTNSTQPALSMADYKPSERPWNQPYETPLIMPTPSRAPPHS